MADQRGMQNIAQPANMAPEDVLFQRIVESESTLGVMAMSLDGQVLLSQGELQSPVANSLAPAIRSILVDVKGILDTTPSSTKSSLVKSTENLRRVAGKLF